MLRTKDMSILVLTLAAKPRRLFPPWELWECGEVVSVVTFDGKSAMSQQPGCPSNSRTKNTQKQDWFQSENKNFDGKSSFTPQTIPKLSEFRTLADDRSKTKYTKI